MASIIGVVALVASAVSLWCTAIAYIEIRRFRVIERKLFRDRDRRERD